MSREILSSELPLARNSSFAIYTFVSQQRETFRRFRESLSDSRNIRRRIHRNIASKYRAQSRNEIIPSALLLINAISSYRVNGSRAPSFFKGFRPQKAKRHTEDRPARPLEETVPGGLVALNGSSFRPIRNGGKSDPMIAGRV